MDALRSHVAQAQARANHIVDEFESMLLVTGGHSTKEVMHIQSQAGLAEDTSLPAAAAAALPLVSLPSLLLMLLLCKDSLQLAPCMAFCWLMGLKKTDGPACPSPGTCHQVDIKAVISLV